MKRRVEMERERDIYVPKEGPQEEHLVEVEDAEAVAEPIAEEPVQGQVPVEESVEYVPAEEVVTEPEVVEYTEPVDMEIEDEIVRENRRRFIIRLIVAMLLLLLLCGILSTCCNGIWRGVQERPQPGIIPVQNCPNGGTMVRIHVPSTLSPTEAELVSNQEQTDIAGRSFEVFMYDDPDDSDWNLIIESLHTATSLCWYDQTGWHEAQRLDDIPEPGTSDHNVEFLIPRGAVSGEATISVLMGP
jgi:hypothetical protein